MKIPATLAKKARHSRTVLSTVAAKDSFTIFRKGISHIEKTLRYWKRGATPELLLKIKPIEDEIRQLKNLPEKGVILTAGNLGITIGIQFGLLQVEIGQAGASGRPSLFVTSGGRRVDPWDWLRAEFKRNPKLAVAVNYARAQLRFQKDTGGEFPLWPSTVKRQFNVKVRNWGSGSRTG